MKIKNDDYKKIPVPEDLDTVLEGAIMRYEKEKRKKWKIGLSVAACITIVFFTMANIEPMYAAMNQIPIMNKIVQVFHIGEGGEITDNKEVKTTTKENKIVLKFQEEAKDEAKAPYYKVDYRLAPRRMIITINGIRKDDLQTRIEEMKKVEGVRFAYRETYLDDSAIRFVIELDNGYDYKVTEGKEPAALEISLEQKEVKEETIYFLATEEMEMGEGLALLCEQWKNYGCATARTASGNFIGVIGEFQTEEEAKTLLEEIQSKTEGEVPFHVKKSLTTEHPL